MENFEIENKMEQKVNTAMILLDEAKELAIKIGRSTALHAFVNDRLNGYSEDDYSEWIESSSYASWHDDWNSSSC